MITFHPRGTAIVVLLTSLVFSGCAPGDTAGGPPFTVDLLPPMILSAKTLDGTHLEFVFDEPVSSDGEVSIEPDLPVSAVNSLDDRITVVFSEEQEIGRLYSIHLSATDDVGNSLGFVYEFSGWNPRVPEILINEINPRGSGNTPDCIELFTRKGGNLGGLRLLVGTIGNTVGEIVFPAVEIADGDYILVHPKAEGLDEELDETDAVDVSGGLLASDTARDFWIPGAPGLPGNNGAVSLYDRKGGEILDAVLWSDRTTDPEDNRLGWTSDGYDFASDLASESAWESLGPVPGPSEAVDVSESTATRSLCRASIPADSDSPADWHTVPTGERSFGGINTDELYIP